MSLGALPLNVLSPQPLPSDVASSFRDKKRFSEAVNKVHRVNDYNGQFNKMTTVTN